MRIFGDGMGVLIPSQGKNFSLVATVLGGETIAVMEPRDKTGRPGRGQDDQDSEDHAEGLLRARNELAVAQQQNAEVAREWQQSVESDPEFAALIAQCKADPEYQEIAAGVVIDYASVTPVELEMITLKRWRERQPPRG
jgi:hypothetical protein